MTSPRSIKKSAAWCWQDKKIMRLIRNYYKSDKKKTTSLALYQSLTEMASNSGSDNEFLASLAKIGRMSGKSVSTIKRYTGDMVKIGILKIENRKYGETINLPNKWILLSPSVHNKEQAPINNIEQPPIHNNEPLLEINVLEKNKLEENVFSSEGYKKALNKVNMLKGIK